MKAKKMYIVVAGPFETWDFPKNAPLPRKGDWITNDSDNLMYEVRRVMFDLRGDTLFIRIETKK